MTFYQLKLLCDLLSETRHFLQILNSSFNHKGCFAAKLGCVTGGAHCIILNYEAQLWCHKHDTSTGRSAKYEKALL